MDNSTRKFIHGLIFSLGLVLIVAGIATQTRGATVIGLIIAAVNLRHWLRLTGQPTMDNDPIKE